MGTLTTSQFKRIADIAYANWGLALTEQKHQLVASRMTKHLRGSPYQSIEQFLDHIENNASTRDMLEFFDILSTNVTSFFRERQHFDYLEREFYTPLAKGNLTTPGRKIRIWSAACSTGPEPYSLAIHAMENLPDIDSWDFKILGTDLANSAVAKAKAGTYPADMVENLPKDLVDKYFVRGTGSADGTVTVCDAVKKLVTVSQLNLMADWPMKGPFDVIFCRNVMIYFDVETKKKLVSRMSDLLRPGGVLVVGSAESLSRQEIQLRTAQPSVYVK
ncbi:MAG TPA: protein-glutamate O-methyltransferase CheR [Phycisphaerales bacterium]|nr:protein-glutamate O-methyltransferase CheR [Phycisphaerales bacterium]